MIGEDRVRLSFNPSGNTQVEDIKRRTADMINWCDDLRQTAKSGEQARLISLAMTAYEEAAMWAVKAATSQ